jgi:hypothetical protein
VLGALAPQDHAPVAVDQLGVKAGTTMRADRPRRCGQHRHARSIPTVYNETMTFALRAAAAGSLLAAGAALVARAGLTLEIGVGRRLRPLGPIALEIAAPPELVFDVIAAPYLGRAPRALRGKLEVIERGADLVLAAHYTAVAPGLTVTTVETVRFERPRRVTFRLVKGPVPHVLERYELRASGTGTAFEYRGELGTDLWALGAWWGAVVAPSWERTVATSLDGIRSEAERRAHRRS